MLLTMIVKIATFCHWPDQHLWDNEHNLTNQTIILVEQNCAVSPQVACSPVPNRPNLWDKTLRRYRPSRHKKFVLKNEMSVKRHGTVLSRCTLSHFLHSIFATDASWKKRGTKKSKESAKECRRVQEELELRCSTVQFQVHTSSSVTFDTRIERW